MSRGPDAPSVAAGAIALLDGGHSTKQLYGKFFNRVNDLKTGERNTLQIRPEFFQAGCIAFRMAGRFVAAQIR